MLQVNLIGHLGANAEVQNYDGGKFIKMRVAHTESWKNENGEKKSRTTWVDCTLNCPNGEIPSVFPYLTAGTLIAVRGDIRLRVYSSQVDKCMKAGMTISVRDIELLGGKSDIVPKQLITIDTGQLVNVTKWYLAGIKVPEDGMQLVDKHGQLYNVDKNGWITPVTVQQDDSNGHE